MPVLDAKALKTDPKGAAFLASVLRQTSKLRAEPKEIPGVGRIRFRMINQLRLIDRSKQLMPHMA